MEILQRDGSRFRRDRRAPGREERPEPDLVRAVTSGRGIGNPEIELERPAAAGPEFSAHRRMAAAGLRSAPIAPMPPALATAIERLGGHAPAIGASMMGTAKPCAAAKAFARSSGRLMLAGVTGRPRMQSTRERIVGATDQLMTSSSPGALMDYPHSAIPERDIPRARTALLQHVVDMYASEINKVVSVWSAFTDSDLEYRPHERSSTVEDNFKHQLLSERRFFGEFAVACRASRRASGACCTRRTTGRS